MRVSTIYDLLWRADRLAFITREYVIITQSAIDNDNEASPAGAPSKVNINSESLVSTYDRVSKFYIATQRPVEYQLLLQLWPCVICAETSKTGWLWVVELERNIFRLVCSIECARHALLYDHNT